MKEMNYNDLRHMNLIHNHFESDTNLPNQPSARELKFMHSNPKRKM